MHTESTCVPPEQRDATLHPHHQQMIAASGIAPEVAAARGYRTVTDSTELLRLGFAGYQATLVPALLIPGTDPAGQNGKYQIRPDQPRLINGRPLKYESQVGSQIWLDAHPAIQPQLRDVTVPLWVSEGARKADAAISAGLCCISLQGVWSWRSLADWSHIALKGRHVYICFDSDVMSKKEVQEALRALTAFLVSLGAKVRLVTLPAGPDGEKVGLDDYLAAGNTTAQLEALAGPVQTLRDLAHDDDTDEHNDRAEIRRTFEEAKERRRRERYVSLLRRERYVRRLVQDGGVQDGDKIAALQMAYVTEEWAQKPAPAGKYRMYMQKAATTFGVARATLTSRVDGLAARTGVLEVDREDRTQALINPRTGRPVINQQTGRVAKAYDTAVMITPRVFGTDLIAAVVDRRFAPETPRERVKKQPRGPRCRKHPKAELVVTTTTTWACPACPADDNVVAERRHVREPERPATLPKFDSPPSAPIVVPVTPATLPEFDPLIPRDRGQNLTPPAHGRDPGWRPGMPTVRLIIPGEAPLPNFGTPQPGPLATPEAVPRCTDCGRHPPLAYHDRCQACILNRLAQKPNARATP